MQRMFFKKKKLKQTLYLGQNYTLLISNKKQAKKIRIINDTDYITHKDIEGHKYLGMWTKDRCNIS